MRRIELFEGFSTDDYYRKINFISKEDRVSIFPKEVEWIKKSLQSEFGKSILVEGRKNISQTNIFFTIFIYKSGSSDGTNLTKLKDEYWVVQLREGENNNLYLCDQWEAVIKLYRDKKIFC